MKRSVFIFSAASILIILVLALIGINFSKHASKSHKDVIIAFGSSASTIAYILEQNDIISNATVFQLITRIRGVGSKFQSGAYRFPSPLSMNEVIDILIEGKFRFNRHITIREGITSKAIAGLIQKEYGIDSVTFIRFVNDKQFIASLGIDAQSLEGYLMPETYLFPEKPSAKEILRMMVSTFRKKFTPELQSRLSRIKKSEREVLTIASIVEGETAIDSERKRVACVYYNRLKRGMLLQADPTVQYIIPDGPRRLYFKDLEINSRYNTYKYKGIPPTPINNPGMASIIAALYPEEHKFIYFVADGSGGHTFSVTEKQHQIAVNKYREIQNKMK